TIDPFMADPGTLSQETFATIWEELDAALDEAEKKWTALRDRAKDEVGKLGKKALDLFDTGGAAANVRKFVDDIRDSLNSAVDAAPAEANALVDRARAAADQLRQRADTVLEQAQLSAVAEAR